MLHLYSIIKQNTRVSASRNARFLNATVIKENKSFIQGFVWWGVQILALYKCRRLRTKICTIIYGKRHSLYSIAKTDLPTNQKGWLRKILFASQKYMVLSTLTQRHLIHGDYALTIQSCINTLYRNLINQFRKEK